MPGVPADGYRIHLVTEKLGLVSKYEKLNDILCQWHNPGLGEVRKAKAETGRRLFGSVLWLKGD
jgi:hypothetical protein